MIYICKTKCFYQNKIWDEGDELNSANIDVNTIPRHFEPVEKVKEEKKKGNKGKKGKKETNPWDSLEPYDTNGMDAKDMVNTLLVNNEIDINLVKIIESITDEEELKKIISFLKS